MRIDIQTENLQPRRQTYAHIARRFGEDRPASRYEEAVLDVQATHNFHYRPLWAPEYELYDPRRTKVQMKDWYELRDPRQYYYGSYNISRAQMEQVTNKNFDFVEKRNLLGTIENEYKDTIIFYLIPMRHYEWGANMNNFLVADYGYGTTVTSAAAFCAADRLGMAQVISKIGLELDGQSASSLDSGKKAWMEDAAWQGVRKNTEDSFVIEDWFHTFVAQNLAMDGIMHPLVFGAFDDAGQRHGASAVTMLSEFMVDWFSDNTRWVDAVVSRAAKESDDNRSLISGWFNDWTARATEAAKPLAEKVLGTDGDAAVQTIAGELEARGEKLGLEVK